MEAGHFGTKDQAFRDLFVVIISGVMVMMAMMVKGEEGMSYKMAGEFPDILTSVIKYINENLQEDLSLASLEKRFYINRSYLGRLCRKYLGISLHRYIILQRIARAQALLAKGNSAMDASKDAGFNDYSNFRKMFKKVTDLSPSAYGKISLQTAAQREYVNGL